MAVSPAEAEEMIIQDVRRTYAQAEEKVIRKVADIVKRGGFEGPNWAEQKLRHVSELTDYTTDEIIQSQLKDEKDKVKRAVRQAYSNGAHDAEDALIKGGKVNTDNVVGTFSQVDQESVKALSRGIEESLNSVDTRILRSADDAYRNVIANASRQGVTGVSARRQVTQQAMTEFAQRGITGFVDNAGKNWSMRGYTEMATRSTMARASLNGSMNRMKQNDHDLAMVGTSYEPCPVCMPWEGRVLSVSGDSDEYPSVEEAEGAGLWHPNCTHSISPYVEGVTEKPKMDKEKKAERYKNRQTQRYNERQIRKWKRRKAGAVTDEDERFAQAKITEWQKSQRDFIDETGRMRKYGREQVADIDMPDVPSKTAAGRYVDSNDWADNLSYEEREEMKEWVQGDWRKITARQDPLKTGPSYMDETIDNMEYALNSAPEYKGKVYRGLGSGLERSQLDEMMASDEGWTLRHFRSSSKSEGVGQKFASPIKITSPDQTGKKLIMEIDSSTGKDISAMSIGGEEEVLFEKGTRFIGKEIVEEEDYLRLIVEEVGYG